MPSRLPNCPRGCFRFSKLPVDAYYRRCGPRIMERLARGERVSAYKKVRNTGSVEMLLKEHGWGPGYRAGGKAARFFPVVDNPCVFRLSREWAARMASAYAHSKLARAARRRVA